MQAPHTIGLVTCLLLGALALTGCRTQDPPGAAGAADAEPEEQLVPGPTERPAEPASNATAVESDGSAGGTVRLYMDEPLEDRNPVLAHSMQYTDVAHYVTESLGRRDRDDTDVWHLALAASVEEVVPLLEYRVTLRSGVRWHPPHVAEPGPEDAWLAEVRHVVSDDFVFFMELLRNDQLDTAHLRHGWLGGLESITAVTDTEFIVRWRSPSTDNTNATLALTPVPRWLYGAGRDGSPLPASTFAAAFRVHWYNDSMVGTGPFRYVGRTPEGGIRLERFDAYWGTPARLERVEFVVRPPDVAEQLVRDQIDAVVLATDVAEALFEAGGPDSLDSAEWNQQALDPVAFAFIGWNATLGMFEDARTRTAMTLAFDRARLTEEHIGDQASVVSGPFVHPDNGIVDPITPLPFDLERAAALLREAGWRDLDGDGTLERNGEPFRFVLLGSWDWSGWQPAFDEFAEALTRIGVEMNVEWTAPHEYQRRVAAQDFDAIVSSWWTGPHAAPEYLWHSPASAHPGEGNLVGFGDAELDAVIDAYGRATSPAERTELLGLIDQRIHDAQPYTFWFSPGLTAIWQRSLHNVSVSDLRPYVSVREAWRSVAP